MAQGISGTLLTTSPLEIGMFQARLDRDTTTKCKLTPYRGRYIEINGYLVDIVSATYSWDTADDKINGSGASGGTGVSNTTLYYVYASNQSVSYAPSSLRLSTTAPTLVNGVKYLGASGDPSNWRFCGWAYFGSTAFFTDTDTQRFVVSQYNRKLARMFTCPAYADGNTTTTWTANSTTWAAANAGTGNKLEFIDNGEDSTFISAQLVHVSVASQYAALGIDVNTGGTATSPQRAQHGSTSQYGSNSLTYTLSPSEGYRTINMSYRTSSVASYTIEADEARNGASADPAMTYIEAEVWI